jgi:hypothetical protein
MHDFTLQIRRSQHSLINPAITIFLHTGAGGHGAPTMCCQNGKLFSVGVILEILPEAKFTNYFSTAYFYKVR